MRIVHISYQYGQKSGGGATIAASRLHEALLNSGMESYFICIKKRDAGRNVHELPLGWVLRLIYFALSKITRAVWKLTPIRKSVGLNLLPLFGLKHMIDVLRPDIIHLHWLDPGMASFNSLSHLSPPMVVHLHDLWMINAIDPSPFRDKRYITGFDRGNSNALERWLVTRKKRFVERKHICFIGPSEWVADACRKSIVGASAEVFLVPNFISTAYMYNPSLVKINAKKVFLFGCDGGAANHYKGFDDIVAAISYISREEQQKMSLWVFGQKSGVAAIEDVEVHYLGYVSDSQKLMQLYHKADVYLFPSKMETQGMTKIEAMLCGLPVIAFERSACAEGVIDGVSGIVVRDGDVEGYARAMVECLSKPFDRSNIASLTHGVFGSEQVLNKIISVYETIARRRSA